ncbi:MAG TPA: sensor histidine kinase [Verrucomicrobiae bacterium]|nr:sensor histidine kinase [Verrucomicrobiae bacterium]
MDSKPPKTENSVETAVAEERQRIARELHDRVLQMLSSARLRMESSRRNLLGQRHRLESELQAIEGIIDRAITEIRNVIADNQNVEALVAGSLERRLKEELEIFRARTGFKLQFQCAIGAPQLPTAIEREIYFTLREGLLNAVRHSRATELRLSLSQDKNGWRAKLSDNGVGFDPETVDGGSHYGLKGMKERILKLGGNFSLKTAPGEGTEIEIIVPFQ